MEWLKENWFLVWAAWLTSVQIVSMLLTKTFARKDDLSKVSREVDELRTRFEHLPTDEEVAKLRLELEVTRGELKAISPQLEQLRNLTQLLLEQHMENNK